MVAPGGMPTGRIGYQLMLNVGAAFLGFIFIKCVYSLTSAFIDVTANAGISASIGQQPVKISYPLLSALRINILQ